MSGALIDYPALAAIAAQFGDGALKTEAKRILSERDAERALTDDLAADYERLATRLTAASEGWFLEGLEALARYREARQR